MRRSTLTVFIVLMTATCELRGQGIAAADRARASDTALPVPPLDPVAASGSTQAAQATPKLLSDDEFGEQIVFAQRANVEPWSLSIDTEYFFTDNVALASAGELRDCYLRTGAQARYTNRISGNWFANASLDGHALLHARYDILDFLLIKGDAGIMYRVPWLADTFVSAGYAGYWISEADFTTESFRNHAATLGAQKVWKLARAMQLVGGLTTEYALASDPSPPKRHEYSAYLGYRLGISDNFSISASYRLGHYDYPEFDRQDWNHVVALGACYSLTKWARVNLSASSAWNRSSLAFFDYQNLVSGLSLSLHMEF